MDNLNENIKLTFFRLLDGDMPLNVFEQWVYKTSDKLETELQTDFYQDLISFNYNQKNSFRQLGDKIKKQIDINQFNLWRTKKLLMEIIENKIDLVLATRKLRNLYFETGENFIPIQGYRVLTN